MGYHKPLQTRSPVDPGTNRRLIQNALEGWNMPRVDTKDPIAVQERIYQYFNYCAEKDISPSVSGCCNWLKVNRGLLQDWYTGRIGTPDHQRVAAMFYGVMQDIWAQDMKEGNINPVSGIFMGKVFYGYKDTQEIVVQQSTNHDELSNSDLIAESKRLPGAERLALPEGTQTIDVDARVLSDPGYARAVERQKRKEERESNRVVDPSSYTTKKEYLKEYYKGHKAEQLARNAKSKAKAKAKKDAERAQNVHPDNK